MKNLKMYLGAISLMLITTQCSLFPWNPSEPIVEPTPEPIEYSEYSVMVGDTVTVSFKSNGTTGYQWKWDNKDACTSVDSVGFSYTVNQTEGPNGELLCGAPGVENWVFKGVSVGTNTLQFSYIRPFEVGVAAIETKHVVIHVYGFSGSSNSCNVLNPVEEIGWLKSAIESVKNDEYAYYVMGNYKGETVFYYGNCNPVIDYVSVIKNCNGDNLGYLNEKLGDIKDKTIIWKHKDSMCEF